MELIKLFTLFFVAVGIKEANSCCMTPQFEAQQSTFGAGGTDPPIMAVSRTIIDMTIRKTYAEYNYNGYLTKEIQDRISNTLYMFNDTSCLKYTMPAEPYRGCIPGSVCTLTKNSTIGTGSSETPVMSYECGQNTTLTFTKDCAPVTFFMKNFHAAEGIPDSTFLAVFSNIKVGISDPSVFTPPSHCYRPNTALHTVPQVMGKRAVSSFPHF